MKQPETFEDLRKLAFVFPEQGLAIRKKRSHKRETRYVYKIPIVRDGYCVVNGMMVFHYKGQEYMLPDFYGMQTILKKAGLGETYLEPAFDRDEVPADKELAKQWEKVEKTVKMIQNRYKKLYAVAMAKAVPLSFEIKRKALEIPPEGFRAYHTEKGPIDVMPVVQLSNLKRSDYDKLGTYKVYHSIAVVVCVTVETYLVRMTPGMELQLQNLGYTENRNLQHPLEGVEKFLDPHVQEKFENL